MISRRKIISRSLDNLDVITQEEQEEDVWYDNEKLFRDHINEVLAKWEQIDDEIWAKIIVFEKNRRVAKAYARSSVITINGSKNDFDGVRLGLNGFDNPMRNSETKVIKKAVGDGFKIKMDDIGSILIKRYGKSNVFVHKTSQANEETVIGADIQQMPQMALTPATSCKLFDMRKFAMNINREISRTYPDRARLERQCLSAITLVKSSNSLIDCPLWILVINVVAIDMLKNRWHALPKTVNCSEDPYSTIASQAELIYPAPSNSDESNNSRDSSNSNQSHKRTRRSHYEVTQAEDSPFVPKPDYEPESLQQAAVPAKRRGKTAVAHRKKQDDPYYCGLLARIPNFIKSSKQSSAKLKKDAKMVRKMSASQQQFMLPMPMPVPVPQPAPPMPIVALHHAYLPYKLYPPQHRLARSQLSLWDARSLISAHD